MSSYNKVILMGNLTRKPEVRYTQSGQAACKVGLAVNRRWKDQSGEWREDATFVDITIWGKRGEAFAKYHDKGRPAFIEGRLQLSTWQDKQSGEKRSKLEVIGESWEFVGGGGRGGQDGGDEESSGGYGGSDGGYAAGGASSAGSGGGGAGGGDFLDVDDTPF